MDYETYYPAGVNIGEEIKRARKAAGITQMELAHRCGWENQGRVSHLETGRRPLDFKDMVKIEDAIGVKRGTLYARARGDISVTSEEDLAVYEKLTADQTIAVISRLVDLADLTLQQRSEIARLLLEIKE